MRADVFQDVYGYWCARRGDEYVGPQRSTRDEALVDLDSVIQPGDIVIADGGTDGTSPPVAPPGLRRDVASGGLAAGTGSPTGPPTVSIEEGPGLLGPLVPAA